MSKKAHIGVCLPRELVEKLRVVAEQESRSMSGLIRVLVRRYIEEFEKENGEVGV